MSLRMYFLMATIIVAAALAIWLTDAVRVYFRYRGKMLLTCPETGHAAAVRVAAGEAARTALHMRPHVCLSECSRWPERQGCGEECLSQLAADPHNCLVWTKVIEWYRGRSCAYCHKPFGELNWHDHRPALVGSERKTVQWNEVAVERLPEVFETYLPVCWSCHIAETFRREHPELVIDRPGNRGPMGELLTDHLPANVGGTPTSRS